MERKVFSSKILYLLNLIFNSGFLVITILSLLALIYIDGNKLIDKNESEQLVLYSIYVIIYTIAVTVLFVKPIKAVFYLKSVYLFALAINFYEFLRHYLKSDTNGNKLIYIIMILIFTMVFMSFIYFNNKYKFKIKFSELDEIGTHND